MDLALLIDALAPVEVVGRAPVDVTDIVYDAGDAGPGSLYFCGPGPRADGHDFAPEAVANGAVALVAQRPLELPVPQLVVEDARRAMPVAADEFFGRPTEQLEVAGVTGTNGKTTTAFLLYAILAAAGRRPGLLGTIETRGGGGGRAGARTPPGGEATSPRSELGPPHPRRFSALVFTNLTQDHLDFHGTLERYFDAKRRLFTETRPPAAVNVGDEHGRRLADELRGHNELLTFGLVDGADLR